MSAICRIQKGATVCRKFPPVPGLPGEETGRDLPPIPGREDRGRITPVCASGLAGPDDTKGPQHVPALPPEVNLDSDRGGL